MSVYLVHNERTKLTASWFNALATGLVAAGGFAPLAALLYGISDLKTERMYVLLLGLVCVSGGIGLHLIGWAFLRRLRE
jgi:hypothetical protein